MLFVVLLITGLGLCTAESTKTAHLLQSKNETVEKTIIVLRSNDVLRLGKISFGLAPHVCKCLQSRFIKLWDDGAVRTLQCYLNQNGIGNPKEDWQEMSTNVKIFAYNEPTDPYAVINVYDPQKRIPEQWQEYYQVIYATGFCFILRTTPGKTRTAPCALFELDGADSAKKRDCYEKFQQKCEGAYPWLEDRKRCDQIARNAKKQS